MTEPNLSLSTAYATWNIENSTEWVIRDQDNNELWKFPRSFEEKGCMSAIHMGRKFELEAFNNGISFGKESRDQVYGPKINLLIEQIKVLEQMNVNLSTKLEKFIIGDDEEVS
jgi:hypothetical protein